MYLFAYGANLNRKQMEERAPGVKAAFAATLPNHQLIFAGYSPRWKGAMASLRRVQGQRVEGAVYDLSPVQMNKMDAIEGRHYRRLPVKVVDGKGVFHEAVAYVQDPLAPVDRPSREYVMVIQEGRRDWGLD
jgi:gamma-glutamylcyclotransferase (GGCT)/AIG2-like uncharacterized protein YtfP